MELLKQHISPHLSLFKKQHQTFLSLFDIIQSNIKVDYKELLNYVNNILNKILLDNNDDLAVLHLHFEDEFNETEKLLIAEYLLVKTFTHYQSTDYIANEPNKVLKECIVELGDKQNRLEKTCPEGASKKNGGNRIWKKWVQNKNDINSLLDFYRRLTENTTLKPKSIINAQKGICQLLAQQFEFRPFAIELESKFQSYNLLNTTNTLSDIDKINNEIIDSLDSIILFDCERKSIMFNFSFEEINKWNSDYGTSFKNYLIVTFGKEHHTINSARNKIDIIKERFKIPINSSYTLLSPEIDFLLKKKENSSISIQFIGSETSSFWDTFHFETSYRELYELRSIKLMNVYSICINDEIKNYILEDIFSKNESSELISLSTKLSLLELRDEDFDVLKEALSNTLGLIIKSDIKSEIFKSLINTQTIIFDEAIARNVKLVYKLTKALDLGRSIKIKTWADLINPVSNNFLILSYRDQGKYPNYYAPNLIEFEYQSEKFVSAILTNFLFGNNFKWSKYYLLKEYHKYLSHPIRENYFDWNKFGKLIQSQKPEAKLSIDWDMENKYSASEIREIYKVKLQNQKAKTYLSSDLLIFTELNIEKPRIERVKWFFENMDFDETTYKIQKIDELLDEFNPAEKLIDTTQQELELEIIRNQLGLENETAGRIWKKLLKNKTLSQGIEATYEELKLIFDKNSIQLVSINHFSNSWINIESESLMPRGNKVFKFLCDFLGLNNNYRLILYRLKNASITGKIEATKKYSNLLKDLFSDGCFDSKIPIQSLLQSKIQFYKNNHSLEEIGIDEENPLSSLNTLIELIQPEIKLMILETIEKIEQ